MRQSSIPEMFPVTSFLLLFILAFFFLEVIVQWKLTGELPPVIWGGIDGRVTWLLGSANLLDLRSAPDHPGRQYWRLLAAAFLHGNGVHLLFNAFVLWDIGRLSEPLLSSWKLLVVYIVAAAAGAASSLLYAQWFVGPPLGDFRHSVGASGAICGLIGLLLVRAIRERDSQTRDGVVRWIGMMVIFSLLAGGFGGAFGRIDHAAHVGGFLAGCAFGLTVPTYMSSRIAARWKYPGYAAAVITVACLALAVRHYIQNR